MNQIDPQSVDVIVIGAGAAGLMCALSAGQRGRRVLVLDHANKVAKKILMSGGGYCNFTNLNTTADNFFSHNPHFCKSALHRYSPYDFLQLVEKHHIEYREKAAGQLFCVDKAHVIRDMLVDECNRAGVKIFTRCEISQIKKNYDFELITSRGEFNCQSLVVASGGLSIPTLGASGFGYQIAQQFGLNVLQTRAALVPFTLDKSWLQKLDGLSGLSLPVSVSCNGNSITEDLLFTHRGLSGPAILQISAYWKPGDEIILNLYPEADLFQLLEQRKQQHPKMLLKNILSELLPKRLAQRCCELWFEDQPIAEISSQRIKQIADTLQHWQLKPSGTEGYRTAEVTLGGVDTDDISSKTFEARKVSGLYFIGEVLDVTGQLGGYNFQWAWASGWSAGQCV